MIEKIIEKLGMYNIFTNIIPGYVFLFVNSYYFNFKINNVVTITILSYFLGLTISRIGSITIGNILLKFSKEKGELYSKYIEATERDEKIELLLQERNSYRTYSTLFLICFIEYLCNIIRIKYSIPNDICYIIIFVILILILIYSISFCKYNKYIAERIRINTKKTKK